ncbi:MAG: IS110 family transposase [Phycisphaerales bacterium]
MNAKYIGFDIDSKKTVACVVQQGQKDRYNTLVTDLQDMQQYLQQERQDTGELHLTFEISGEAGLRYDALRPYVDTLTVSNPHKMTWVYRTSKKNDRIDARKQAVLLSIGEVPPVHIPKRQVRQWRVTIQQRRGIVNRIVSVKNRIRALLRANGLARPAHPGSLWKADNVQWMRQQAQDWTEVSAEQLWRAHLTDLLEEFKLLGGQLQSVTCYLDRTLADHGGGKLLRSIPGVGPRTAEAILAYTDEVRRFKRSKQYAAYFGLTPKLDESGQTRRLGHISKEGPAVVRWLLVESVWRAIRKSPAIKAFYEQIVGGQNQRKKAAVVATARKLLTIMWAMLKTGELFNEELVSGKKEQDPQAVNPQNN